MDFLSYNLTILYAYRHRHWASHGSQHRVRSVQFVLDFPATNRDILNQGLIRF